MDGNRYWYATQPSVTRVALERAQQYKEEDVLEEIKRRLREELKEFAPAWGVRGGVRRPGLSRRCAR